MKYKFWFKMMFVVKRSLILLFLLTVYVLDSRLIVRLVDSQKNETKKNRNELKELSKQVKHQTLHNLWWFL